MRILIIIIFGILSYLAVLVPGYFLFFPEVDESFSNKKLKKVSIEISGKKAKQPPLKDPGDEPPPK